MKKQTPQEKELTHEEMLEIAQQREESNKVFEEQKQQDDEIK